MAAPSIFRLDRFEQSLGPLHIVGEVTHSEELNGEDTLTFATVAAPVKGDRLLWYDDEDGCWREHVVVRTTEALGRPCEVYAEGSVCELIGDFVGEVHAVDKNAPFVVAALLKASGSRWVTDPDPKVGLGGGIFYHTNALAALRRVCDEWEVDAFPHVDVEGGRVTRRWIEITNPLGPWRGARFSYGKNMTRCTRTVLADEVCTALYGFGAGLPITDDSGKATGGYRRRLTFGEANGGVNWVGDETARELWGRWNADRTAKVHVFGQVIFPLCDSPYELLARTKGELIRRSTPRVSYEVDVALLEGARPVRLGDDVAVVDTSRDPAWHLTARVLRRVRTLGDGTRARVTLGTVKPTDAWTMYWLRRRAVEADDAASAAGDAAVAMSTDVTTLTTKVGNLETAAGTTETGEVPTLATQAYVDDAIAALDDLSGVSF